MNKSCTSSGTGTEQALVPSINYINNTNNLNKKNISNLEKQAKNFEEKNNSFDKIVIPSAVEGTQKEKSSAKKEKEEMFEYDFVMPSEVEATQKEKSSAKKQKEEMFKYDVVMPSAVEATQKEKKLREKKKVENNGFSTSSAVEKPTIEQVKTYFQENNFPEIEAQKFFNYFSSVGWLVGGKAVMVNWKAAAQNWMINAPNFIQNTHESNRAKNLNTTTEKDYSEPL